MSYAGVRPLGQQREGNGIGRRWAGTDPLVPGQDRVATSSRDTQIASSSSWLSIVSTSSSAVPTQAIISDDRKGQGWLAMLAHIGDGHARFFLDLARDRFLDRFAGLQEPGQG